MFGDYENYPLEVHLKFIKYYERVNELTWDKVLPIFFKKKQLKKRGFEYYTLCIFHSEKTASLKFDLRRGLYHCFGCGGGGTIFQFICKIVGSSNYGDGNIVAMKFVKKHFGIPLPFTKKQWCEVKTQMRSLGMDLVMINCSTVRESEDEELELFRINGLLQEIAFENSNYSEPESFEDDPFG